MLQGNKFGSNEEVISETEAYFQIVLHKGVVQVLLLWVNNRNQHRVLLTSIIQTDSYQYPTRKQLEQHELYLEWW